MEKPREDKSSNISIASGGDTNINGDVVGRDKITHVKIYQGLSPQRPQPRNPIDKDTDFQIVDVAAVIDYSIAELEQYLGQPIEVVSRGIGAAEELPEGGETRVYRTRKYVLNVNYDKGGIARGIQIVEGLSEAAYILEQWHLILSRFSMTVLNQPDIVAPAARHWKNYLGYTIVVAADKPNGFVWTVRIYKKPT